MQPASPQASEPSAFAAPYVAGASPSLSGTLGPTETGLASGDPRSSSAQSLVSPTQNGARGSQTRTLLVVYIHGFMGNKSSFRSFPAHVHSLLKGLLGETHAIHTKIYPRYKTYKSIKVACDNFSKWLAPHESPTTDVVLLGHSMGGLLAAEAVLLPSQSPYGASTLFRHRILGTISLDAPLLGLHPGIVVSGIASLFRPAPSPPSPHENTRIDRVDPAQSQQLSPNPSIYSDISPTAGAGSPSFMPYPSDSTLDSSSHDSPDPYLDPPFVNDVAFVDRGWLKNVIHFAVKHKEENLVSAAANHIMSHLEFGACLADYPELRSRYNRLRELEDVDDSNQSGAARVRFVNYYTVSTGLIKKPKLASSNRSLDGVDRLENSDKSPSDADPQVPTSPRISTEGSCVPTPRISVEECDDGPHLESLQLLEPIPEPETPEEPSDPPSRTQEDAPEADPTTVDDDPEDGQVGKQDLILPPIPDLPSPPTPPDFDAYPDKESRKAAKTTFKLAQKSHADAVKARDKALKNRDKAIKDHQKALEKQQRQALKKKNKEAKLHKPPSAKNKDSRGKDEEKNKKPPRRRKFCTVPPKGSAKAAAGDARDPAWVEVYMEGVDEVGAHCGLFLPGPHYERLVGDVGERIANWVWEDASRRVIMTGGGDDDPVQHSQGPLPTG